MLEHESVADDELDGLLSAAECGGDDDLESLLAAAEDGLMAHFIRNKLGVRNDVLLFFCRSYRIIMHRANLPPCFLSKMGQRVCVCVCVCVCGWVCVGVSWLYYRVS